MNRWRRHQKGQRGPRDICAAEKPNSTKSAAEQRDGTQTKTPKQPNQAKNQEQKQSFATLSLQIPLMLIVDIKPNFKLLPIWNYWYPSFPLIKGIIYIYFLLKNQLCILSIPGRNSQFVMLLKIKINVSGVCFVLFLPSTQKKLFTDLKSHAAELSSL